MRLPSLALLLPLTALRFFLDTLLHFLCSDVYRPPAVHNSSIHSGTLPCNIPPPPSPLASFPSLVHSLLPFFSLLLLSSFPSVSPLNLSTRSGCYRLSPNSPPLPPLFVIAVAKPGVGNSICYSRAIGQSLLLYWPPNCPIVTSPSSRSSQNIAPSRTALPTPPDRCMHHPPMMIDPVVAIPLQRALAEGDQGQILAGAETKGLPLGGNLLLLVPGGLR